MRSYRDLETYNLSYELAMRTHRMALGLPKHELYEEGSQLRRSSKGITSCIVHLNFIGDTHEDTALEEIQALLQAYEKLGGKINKFIRYVEEEWK